MKVTKADDMRLVIEETPWRRAVIVALPVLVGAFIFAGFSWGHILVGGIILILAGGYFAASAQWMTLTLDDGADRITIERDPIFGDEVVLHMTMTELAGVALEVTEIGKLRLNRLCLDLPSGHLPLSRLPGFERGIVRSYERANAWLG